MGSISTFLLKNTTTRQTVIRNGFWRFLAIGFNKVIRLVVLLVVARWLGPNEFGTYNYVLSLATFTFIFADWGINLLFTRDSQRREDTGRLFSAALMARIIISTASLLIACVAAVMITGAQSLPLLLVALALFLGNIRELYVVAMIAKQRGELEMYSSLIEGLINIVGIVLILYGMRTAVGFCVFNIFVATVSLFATAWIVKARLAVHLTRPSRADVVGLLKNGFPLALFGIATYLFFSADQLLIKYFLGTEAVGYYALATRPVYAAMLIPSLLVSVIFPVLSRITHEVARLKHWLNKGVGLLMLAGALIAGAIIIARPLILIAAPQYSQSLPIIAVLSVMLIFLFPSLWLDNLLIALNKQKQDFYFTMCAAVLNVVLNFIWIPIYGIYGAAYASIVAQALNMTITFIYTKNLLNKQHAMSTETLVTTSETTSSHLSE